MNIAIIFAGGVGTRMNTKDKPKQFLMVHGKPLLFIPLKSFKIMMKLTGLLLSV